MQVCHPSTGYIFSAMSVTLPIEDNDILKVNQKLICNFKNITLTFNRISTLCMLGFSATHIPKNHREPIPLYQLALVEQINATIARWTNIHTQLGAYESTIYNIKVNNTHSNTRVASITTKLKTPQRKVPKPGHPPNLGHLFHN